MQNKNMYIFFTQYTCCTDLLWFLPESSTGADDKTRPLDPFDWPMIITVILKPR